MSKADVHQGLSIEFMLLVIALAAFIVLETMYIRSKRMKA
jgi:hypothetical protein